MFLYDAITGIFARAPSTKAATAEDSRIVSQSVQIEGDQVATASGRLSPSEPSETLHEWVLIGPDARATCFDPAHPLFQTNPLDVIKTAVISQREDLLELLMESGLLTKIQEAALRIVFQTRSAFKIFF